MVLHIHTIMDPVQRFRLDIDIGIYRCRLVNERNFDCGPPFSSNSSQVGPNIRINLQAIETRLLSSLSAQISVNKHTHFR